MAKGAHLHPAIAGHVACAILRRVIQAKLEERAPEAVPYKEVNAYTLREIKSGGGSHQGQEAGGIELFHQPVDQRRSGVTLQRI